MSVASSKLWSVEAEKFCPHCGLSKHLSQFSWRDSAHTRTQSYCKDCANRAWRKWYRNQQNRLHHLELVAIRRRRRNERNLRLVRELKSRPCADCGQAFPSYVMDFDHIGPKSAEISSMVRTLSTERLLAEVGNCEVVCANCHRVRTYMRLERRGVAELPAADSGPGYGEATY
jgi:hypothetical protein